MHTTRFRHPGQRSRCSSFPAAQGTSSSIHPEPVVSSEPHHILTRLTGGAVGWSAIYIQPGQRGQSGTTGKHTGNKRQVVGRNTARPGELDGLCRSSTSTRCHRHKLESLTALNNRGPYNKNILSTARRSLGLHTLTDCQSSSSRRRRARREPWRRRRGQERRRRTS